MLHPSSFDVYYKLESMLGFRLPLTHEYVANRYSIFLKTCEEHKIDYPD